MVKEAADRFECHLPGELRRAEAPPGFPDPATAEQVDVAILIADLWTWGSAGWAKHGRVVNVVDGCNREGGAAP